MTWIIKRRGSENTRLSRHHLKKNFHPNLQVKHKKQNRWAKTKAAIEILHWHAKHREWRVDSTRKHKPKIRKYVPSPSSASSSFWFWFSGCKSSSFSSSSSVVGGGDASRERFCAGIDSPSWEPSSPAVVAVIRGGGGGGGKRTRCKYSVSAFVFVNLSQSGRVQVLKQTVQISDRLFLFVRHTLFYVEV